MLQYYHTHRRKLSACNNTIRYDYNIIQNIMIVSQNISLYDIWIQLIKVYESLFACCFYVTISQEWYVFYKIDPCMSFPSSKDFKTFTFENWNFFSLKRIWISSYLCMDTFDITTRCPSDGESVLKRKAIAYVVYSTQTGIRLNRGHYIKRSHLLSKHAFIGIVNTTKVHSLRRWRT